MRNRILAFVAAAFAAYGFAGGAAAAEIELKAVAGVPTRSVVTQVFLRWVEEVNKKGKGLVQIKYLGAGEITPTVQQAAALKRGLFDMLYTPGAFYAGQVKQVDALIASNMPIETMRSNGAIEILEKLWREQLDARILGWFDTHVHFTVMLSKDGRYNTPDSPGQLKDLLKGNKLWATPTFREFFIALGATPVFMPITEIMPSLDKGVVQGYGFPEYGATGLGLQRVSALRFKQPYYRGNTMAMVNGAKWDSLPQPVKDFLTREALAYEVSSKAFIQAEVDREDKVFKAAGMQDVLLPGEIGRKYSAIAHDIAWTRLAKRSPEHAEKLRQLMYDATR